jgi:endonuclease-8
MPEGDTIFRTAVRLRPVLEQRRIASASASQDGLDAASLAGRSVTSIEARGKHLLIHIDDRRAIHSHLGMHGSWHVYAAGEAWQKNPRLARLVLYADAADDDARTSTPDDAATKESTQTPTGAESVCVCFHPKVLELLTEMRLRRHPHLSRLGPDLLAGELDDAEVLRRFRVQNPTPIGHAVMNQTIVCGIGNVYKSEVLFLTRVNPFVPVAELSDQQILQIAHTAQDWLRRNVAGGYPRRTRFGLDGGRLWVYGRSNRSCFVCGQRILVRRQGDLGRTTFWCPQCQPPRDE